MKKQKDDLDLFKEWFMLAQYLVTCEETLSENHRGLCQFIIDIVMNPPMELPPEIHLQ